MLTLLVGELGVPQTLRCTSICGRSPIARLDVRGPSANATADICFGSARTTGGVMRWDADICSTAWRGIISCRKATRHSRSPFASTPPPPHALAVHSSHRLTGSTGSVSRSHTSAPDHFMQPELPTTSHTSTTDSSRRRQSPTSQHGLHDRDHSQPVPLSSGSEEGTAADEQAALDAALAASLQEQSDAVAHTPRRPSPPSTPSPNSRNRVAQYENALNTSVKRREGPAFEVIRKHRSPGDRRSPISDLPNGSYPGGRWRFAC